MKKYFLVFLISIFSLIFSVTPSLAITGIVFTTEPQTIAPAATSGEITVSSGEAVGETADLFLTSSSATGEFSSNASDWKPVPKMTWNTNWAKRTFYYRDAAAGNYTITATLTGRTSNQSFTATQPITVGDGGAVPDQTNDGGANVANDDSDLTGAISAHSSPTALSAPAKAPAKPLTFDIGRDRLVSVGAPVTFRAKVTGGGTGEKNRGTKITWSFGDGGSAIGPEPTHFYYFPGIYIVIATADQSDESAIARTTVEVIQPQAEIGEVGFSPRPYMQIVNRAPRELNLGFWQIRTNGKSLILPADTLIAGQKKIYLPLDPAKISLAETGAVDLLYPNGQMAATKSLPVGQSETEIWRELQNELGKLAALLAARLNP